MSIPYCACMSYHFIHLSLNTGNNTVQVNIGTLQKRYLLRLVKYHNPGSNDIPMGLLNSVDACLHVSLQSIRLCEGVVAFNTNEFRINRMYSFMTPQQTFQRKSFLTRHAKRMAFHQSATSCVPAEFH